MRRRTALIASATGIAGFAGMSVLGLGRALGSWSEDGHGWGRRHGNWAGLCRGDGLDRLDEGLDWVETELAIRVDQQPAWR